MIRRRLVPTYSLDALIRLDLAAAGMVDLITVAVGVLTAVAIVANPPAGPTYTETT